MPITNFEDMIYGEDGQSPIRGTLERVWSQAKSDKLRMQIEVRSQQEGTPSSRQEHRFVIDPNKVITEGVMRTLIERLNESPGEGFVGTIRINFSQAGSGGDRYGSFQRTIQQPPHEIDDHRNPVVFVDLDQIRRTMGAKQIHIDFSLTIDLN